MLIKKVYSLPEKSAKKDFIFNMFGSMSNAAVSVLLLAIVSNISGKNDAGVFSLAYSTAQLMYTIAAFEMRNIQITDAKREFSFSDVFVCRCICIIIMAVVCAIFIFANGYTGTKAAAVAVLCLYMGLMAFSEVFQGQLHLNGHLAVAGRSLGCQVLLAAVSFFVALLTTRNLIISIVFMPVMVALWIIAYDIPFSRNFAPPVLKYNFSAQKKLILSALPLFLSTFLHQYIFNAPKYAIDRFLTEEQQSYYGFLVMPAFFINLLSLFVFRPQLVSLSEKWFKHKFTDFSKSVKRLYAWVALVTVFALAVGYASGIPVLEIIFSAELSGKKNLLIILLLAGGFSAGCTLTLTMLTVMHKQRYCLIAYAVLAVFALIVPNVLVKSYGLLGAAFSYLFEMLLLFAILMIVYFVCYIKTVKSHKEV